MGIRLSRPEKESYLQVKTTLVLGNISFKKRDLKAFVKFLFEHFPEISREDATSLVFWGKVGKCIYSEKVKGNFRVGKFNVLFKPIYRLIKEGESFSSIHQGVDEPFIKFVDRLHESIE